MTGLQSWFDPGQCRESGGRTSEQTGYPASAESGTGYDPPGTD